MDKAKAPRCPGCHFGCALDAYQCGRGKEFYELAASGQEVPERTWPMFTPSERAAGAGEKPPVNERVMRGLAIAAGASQRRQEETGARRVVAMLAHGGMFMSPAVLSKRSRISREDLERDVDAAVESGLVERDEEAIAPLRGDKVTHVVQIVRLTDAGRAQADAWRRERDLAAESFLAPLSSDEREQLDALLMKLVRPGMRPPQ